MPCGAWGVSSAEPRRTCSDVGHTSTRRTWSESCSEPPAESDVSRHDALRRFGLLTVEGFLDAQSCARLRDEARSAQAHQARIATDDGEWKVDEELRRAKTAHV